MSSVAPASATVTVNAINSGSGPGPTPAMAISPPITTSWANSNQPRRWPRRPNNGRRQRSTSGAHRNLKEYASPALAIIVMSLSSRPSSRNQ